HQDRRLHHKSPGQGDALLLASGQLHGIVIHSVGQPDAFEQRLCPDDTGWYVAAGQLVRQQDVFFGGQRGKQLVALENESDFAPPHQRQLIFGQPGDVHAVNHDGPRGRRVQSCQQPEQRALAAPRSAHDRDKLAGRDFQINSAKDLDAMAPAIEGLGEIPGGKNRRGVRHFFYYGGRPQMNVILRWILIAALAAAPAFAQTRKVLVVFGDSLSAGYGLPAGQSFPDNMQRTLDKQGYAWQVRNLGISGDTTEGGVSRIGSAIRLNPAVVLLELGGNDGLRGLPLKVTRQNLEKMIVAF